MLATALTIGLPLLAAGASFAWRAERSRPSWLLVGAAGHLAGAALAVAGERRSGWAWLALDPPGAVVLALVSVLFALCAVYALGYLRVRTDQSNRVFCASLLVFLAMMSLITWTSHLALMWVAVEATTLSSAPLLYFNRNALSLEATWKYLMVGSVGIALALLGSFFVGYSSAHAGPGPSLLFEDLVAAAPRFSRPWLDAGFVLLLVGYGTKMGLAPLHTWKPDAYGEAPGLVGALLAGGMTSCAFLAILRVHRIVQAAGGADFAGRILVVLGLLSMALAGVFMVRQRDFKRMLAYSSVEHMGILALGLGLGGAGVFGSLLHMVNNGLVKGVMFMTAGNIHRSYGSKHLDTVGGAMRRVPLSAGLFLAGFIAVTGSPPFGPFVSEFTVLSTAVDQQRYVVAAGMLLFLLVVFMGMGATVLAVVQGPDSGARGPHGAQENGLITLPPLLLLLASLVMGLLMPGAVREFIETAAQFVRGAP